MKTLLDLLVERKAEAALRSSSRSETEQDYGVMAEDCGHLIATEETGFLILISFWVMCHQKGNTIMIFMTMMTFMMYFAAGDNTSEKGGSEGSCRECSWKPVGHCG